MGKPDADPSEAPWLPSEPYERDPRISSAAGWGGRNAERWDEGSSTRASRLPTASTLALPAGLFETTARTCEAVVQRASASGRVRAWVG